MNLAVYTKFLQRYSRRTGGEYGPELFVKEVLKLTPDEKQLAVLRAYGRYERRIAFRSGHGVGKSAVASWIIVHHMLTERRQKTAVTAPTAPQLFDVLYPEIKSAISRLPEALQGLLDVQADHIFLRAAPADNFLTAKTSKPETPEALAGIHADSVLLIADEASGVHEKVFEAASGSMSAHTATTLLLGNPVRTSGLFFDVFNKPSMADDWVRIHSSCVGHPRISPDFIRDMENRYGVDSNAFRVRVLGEFPRADDDTLIPFELVEAAGNRRDHVAVNPKAPTYWGVDVARFGNDRASLAKRKANIQLEPVRVWKGLDIMQLTGAVHAEWDMTPKDERPLEILVDAIGIGAGVADRLREMGLPARGINVSESAALSDRFVNLRAELWMKAKEWLAKLDCSLHPKDHVLQRELVIPKYTFRSNGKMLLESKDDMKKRGFDSPDVADAFVLTFAGTAAIAAFGNTQRTWGQAIKRGLQGIV